MVLSFKTYLRDSKGMWENTCTCQLSRSTLQDRTTVFRQVGEMPLITKLRQPWEDLGAKMAGSYWIWHSWFIFCSYNGILETADLRRSSFELEMLGRRSITLPRTEAEAFESAKMKVHFEMPRVLISVTQCPTGILMSKLILCWATVSLAVWGLFSPKNPLDDIQGFWFDIALFYATAPPA